MRAEGERGDTSGAKRTRKKGVNVEGEGPSHMRTQPLRGREGANQLREQQGSKRDKVRHAAARLSDPARERERACAERKITSRLCSKAAKKSGD